MPAVLVIGLTVAAALLAIAQQFRAKGSDLNAYAILVLAIAVFFTQVKL